MATPAEIKAAMTGFPRKLTWKHDYPQRDSSPSPGVEASTGYKWSRHTGQPKLVHGVFRFPDAKVTVELNRHATWATPAARASADLLIHEQGHYDITGLIARDWISKVLNLSIPETGVRYIAPNDRMLEVSRQFNAEVDRFTESAERLLNRFQGDPNTGRGGIYNTDTDDGKNPVGQKEWTDRLERVKANITNFELWLYGDEVF